MKRQTTKQRVDSFGEPDPQFPGPKPRKAIPHAFVLDSLTPLAPRTHPMFGCVAVYVGEKIVLVLRDKPSYPEDNGVWLATTHDHHESLRLEFPSMCSIGLLGKQPTRWQLLPASAADFEEAALRACELILAGDVRIGKLPGKRARGAKETKPKPESSSTRKRKRSKR